MYKRISVVASALIWILLPKCSACLMAYMGLFSALGLGRVINRSYMLPVIWSLLLINIGASLFLALKQRQYLYAAISFSCMLVFFVNKIFLGSMVAVNVLAGCVLVAAALRIRFMRLRKRTCLFADGELPEAGGRPIC